MARRPKVTEIKVYRDRVKALEEERLALLKIVMTVNDLLKTVSEQLAATRRQMLEGDQTWPKVLKVPRPE